MARGKQLKKTITSECLLTTAAEEFYERNKVKGLAAATQKSYRDYVGTFANWCGEDFILSDIDSRLMDNYMAEKINGGMKSVTVATHMRHLRAFINFCNSRGYVGEVEVIIPKFEKELKEPYTDEEMALLLKKPSSNNWVEYRSWVMVNYFFATGQRLSTVLHIKVSDLDFKNSRVKLEWNKDKIKKWMPLSSAIVKVLKEYIDVSDLAPQDYLFPEYEGKQLKIPSAQCAIANYNRERGVSKTSIHLFRHTFAKNYIMAGGSAAKLQKLMNHKTMDMTMRYVNLYSEDIANDLDLFNPLDSFNRANYAPKARKTIK